LVNFGYVHFFFGQMMQIVIYNELINIYIVENLAVPQSFPRINGYAFDFNGNICIYYTYKIQEKFSTHKRVRLARINGYAHLYKPICTSYIFLKRRTCTETATNAAFATQKLKAKTEKESPHFQV